MKIGEVNRHLRWIVVFSLILVTVLGFGTFNVQIVSAATTAEVTVNATGAYIAITDNLSAYDFGIVAASSTTNTTTEHVGITNASTIQTDITIAVTSATWSSSGVGWTHDDGGSAGANTAAMKSQRGGVWGASVVTVQNGSPQYIYENCPALTDFDYGLSLLAPTSFTDGAENTITVQISAAAG